MLCEHCNKWVSDNTRRSHAIRFLGYIPRAYTSRTTPSTPSRQPDEVLPLPAAALADPAGPVAAAAESATVVESPAHNGVSDPTPMEMDVPASSPYNSEDDDDFIPVENAGESYGNLGFFHGFRQPCL